jgi:hypothetical protein
LYSGLPHQAAEQAGAQLLPRLNPLYLLHML